MRTSFKTDRLGLRPQTLEDASAMATHMGAFDFARMTGSVPYPFLLPSAEMRVIINRIKSRQGHRFVWAICHKDDPAWMGNIALFKSGEDWEIGYGLGAPFCGRGYMREAIAAVLRETVSVMPQLRASVYHDNPASIHLLETFGFHRLGSEDTAFCMARGAHVPVHHYRRMAQAT